MDLLELPCKPENAETGQPLPALSFQDTSLCVMGELLFLSLEEARKQEWPFPEVRVGMAVLFF